MVNKKTRKRGKTKDIFFLNKLVVKNFNNLKNYTKRLLFGKNKRKYVKRKTKTNKKKTYKMKGGNNCKTHTLRPANYDENFSDKSDLLQSVIM